jgi:LysM domain
MPSLTAHLRQAGSHGRLPFHPGCPACRSERLHGALLAQPVVSSRTRAGLAAAVLAASAGSIGPSLAFAAPEVDQEEEGQAGPEMGGDELSAPGFDPGGPVTQLGPDRNQRPAPEIDGSPPGSGGPGDGEVDPPAPPVAPEATAPDESQGTGEGASPPEAFPQPPPPPGVDEPDERGHVGEPAEESEPQAEAPERDDARRGRGRRPTSNKQPTKSVGDPPASAASGADSPHIGYSSSARGGDAAPTGVHVVQGGDTLWSIARGLLGPSATNAEIAREVELLWRLNWEVIGTGDPDLILPGQHLRLL